MKFKQIACAFLPCTRVLDKDVQAGRHQAGCRVESNITLSRCHCSSATAPGRRAREVWHEAVMLLWLIWGSCPVLCPQVCACLIALSAGPRSLNCGLGVSASSPWNKGRAKEALNWKRLGKMKFRPKNKGIGAFVMQSFQVHGEAQHYSRFVLDHRWKHLTRWNVTTPPMGVWGFY